MRERQGPYLQFSETARVWLDEEHSSFRLPRRLPHQCLEKGCFAHTPLVYCQQHYPLFEHFPQGVNLVRTRNGGVGVINNDLAVSLVKHMNICEAVLPQDSNNAKGMLENYKAFVLLYDLIVLNWDFLQSYPNFSSVMLQKMHAFSSEHSKYRHYPLAAQEFAMRYAFLESSDEFLPSICLLGTLGYEQSRDSKYSEQIFTSGSAAAAAAAPPSRSKVTAARDWLASTGVVGAGLAAKAVKSQSRA